MENQKEKYVIKKMWIKSEKTRVGYGKNIINYKK